LTKPAGDTASLDPDLTRILDAWPTLPDPIRRAVMALVETSSPPGESGKSSK
jgi:hypothetical protein